MLHRTLRVVSSVASRVASKAASRPSAVSARAFHVSALRADITVGKLAPNARAKTPEWMFPEDNFIDVEHKGALVGRCLSLSVENQLLWVGPLSLLVFIVRFIHVSFSQIF